MMNFILKTVLCASFIFAINSSLNLYAYDFEEIKKNVADACRQYQKTSSGTRLILSQKRRETAQEDFNQSEVTVKYIDPSYYNMECKTPESVSAVASNPQYMFKVVNQNDKGWVVLDVVKETQQVTNNLEVEAYFIRLVRFFPIYINHLSLEHLIMSDVIECHEINSFQNEKNEEVIQIKLKIKDPSKRLGSFSINFSDLEIWFIPQLNGWLPAGYTHRETVGKNRYECSVNIDYEKVRDLTVPVKYIAKLKENENLEFVTEEGTFYYFDSDHYEKKDFTLSAYGLPEPDFGESRASRMRYIILVTGLLLISLGVWRYIGDATKRSHRRYS